MSELQELIREVIEYQEQLRQDGISEDEIGQMTAPYLNFVNDEYDAHRRLMLELDGVEYGGEHYNGYSMGGLNTFENTDELIPQQQQMQHLPSIDPPLYAVAQDGDGPYNGMTLEEVVNGDPEAAIEWLAQEEVNAQVAIDEALENKAAEEDNATSPQDDDQGWVELRDEVSGLPYWYNEATGGREWVNPRWVKHHDEVSGLPYWYHALTGESRWEDPTAGRAAPKKSRRKKSRRKKSRRKKSRMKKS